MCCRGGRTLVPNTASGVLSLLSLCPGFKRRTEVLRKCCLQAVLPSVAVVHGHTGPPAAPARFPESLEIHAPGRHHRTRPWCPAKTKHARFLTQWAANFTAGNATPRALPAAQEASFPVAGSRAAARDPNPGWRQRGRRTASRPHFRALSDSAVASAHG